MRTARKRAAATGALGRTEHHELLDVPPGASLDDIKRAYRHLAREVHPDTNPNDPAAANHFRQLTEAYEALAAMAPDPSNDVDGEDEPDPRRSPIWNVFSDQPPDDGPDEAARAGSAAGTTAGSSNPTLSEWLRYFGQLVFDRTEPPIELPRAIADRILRLLLVLPVAWAAAGVPGMSGRGIGDVGQVHALLSLALAVVGWFVIGALLWARAPVVPKELPRWRSPGWDGTALIFRLMTFFVLAIAATAVVLVPRLEGSISLQTRAILVWGLLLGAAWVASGQVPRRLGYQSRYERYWRLDTASLPRRTRAPRPRPR